MGVVPRGTLQCLYLWGFLSPLQVGALECSATGGPVGCDTYLARFPERPIMKGGAMPPTPAQIQGLRVNWRGHPDLPARCVEFTLPLFRAGVEPLPLAFICENIAL